MHDLNYLLGFCEAILERKRNYSSLIKILKYLFVTGATPNTDIK